MFETHLYDADAPSEWIKRFAPLIPSGGRVLDLASGRGRHSRFLAGLGYRVEAVDRDADALESLRGFANIVTRQADVESGPWPYYSEVFDAVVVTNYLYRPLLPQIVKLIEQQGVLIYETFMVGNERFGKPTNPAFLLRTDELLNLARNRLRVIAFEQGEIHEPRPAVVQRICCVRGNLGVLAP